MRAIGEESPSTSSRLYRRTQSEKRPLRTPSSEKPPGERFADVVARASLTKELKVWRSSHLGRAHQQKRDSLCGEERRNSIVSALQCSAIEPGSNASSHLPPFPSFRALDPKP